MGKKKIKNNNNEIQTHMKRNRINFQILLLFGILTPILMITSYIFFAEKYENYQNSHKTYLTQTQVVNFTLFKRYELPHSSLAYT